MKSKGINDTCPPVRGGAPDGATTAKRQKPRYSVLPEYLLASITAPPPSPPKARGLHEVGCTAAYTREQLAGGCILIHPIALHRGQSERSNATSLRE